MARLLVIGGGCRGRSLARDFVTDGGVARIVTRTEAGRGAIESAGAECWIGTPDRIGSLRGALAGVSVICWLLGTASGDPETLAALHGSRLEMMLSQAIDTTIRGIVYEAAGSVDAPLLERGAALVAAAAASSSIPFATLHADPAGTERWLAEAVAAVSGLLAGRTS